MRIESQADFTAMQSAARERNAGRRQQVLVCCGTGCLASGSKKVAEAFAAEVAERGLDAEVATFVKPTGCHGFCERGPLVVLQPAGILYTKVKPGDVAKIIDETLVGGEVIPRLLYKNPVDGERVEQYAEVPFYKHQVRVAMRNIGRIDPTDIDDAIAEGAYEGLARALFELDPQRVLDEVAAPRASVASCCATATRATRAPSRTARSWRAIPTRCSRAW